MQRTTEPVLILDHEAYLAALEELTAELQRAINAVTEGALSDFEASLVRQQAGCARLAALTSQRPAALTSHGSGTAADHAMYMSACADRGIAARIQAAVSALGSANRRYSKLVKHFGETARLFAGMFRPYGGPARLDSYPYRPHRGWSCEL